MVSRIYQALEAILKKYYEEEEMSYYEKEPDDSHIFNDLRIIRLWMYGEEK
jgi:hypothetical protein